MGEHTELRRSITNDKKITYKFNDKSSARYKGKDMQNLWATLENNCMLYSVTKPCQ